ncbi:MAG: SDR family oxidoreductase [Phycisphaerae bacterium]|nr:SDR family oxidoreductase [Phycisphaerae bacterium]NUQ45513.1 SDR family oxidoreductase [Phycisphaerae bacterium]
MSVYLVTGGAGFIGSHLVERLVEQGRRLRVVDNFLTGKRENIAPFLDRVEFIEGDLRDPEMCRRACTGVSTVFHVAAMPSVPKSVADPVASHDHNVNATFYLLVAARDAGVQRFIYSASSSAYGDTPVLPKAEHMSPDPLSPYAVNKLAGEQYCRAFACVYGLKTVSLRYFNVFGPRQDPMSQYAAAIPAFVTRIMAGVPPIVYGDGEQTRDFTYIDNVVQANLLAAEADGLNGQTLNIACGDRISVNRIIARINELLGKSVRPRYVPPRAGDIKHSWADITLAQRTLGFRPAVSFDDGLQRSIRWYTEHPVPVADEPS